MVSKAMRCWECWERTIQVMTEVLTHFAHRSGQSSYQRCPRSWYWGYSWDSIGLTRTRLDIPLARGIFVHRGLQAILQGKSIDDAITIALAEFDKEITSRGLDVASLEDSNYVYREQRALVEAMLYGWWKKRYPELIERYEILEVEHEEVWEVGEFEIGEMKMTQQIGVITYGARDKVKLVWLGKADALLREKDTGDLYLQSFKTTGEWDSRKDSAGMHDIQGLSELCAVEHRLSEWWEWMQHTDPEDPTEYSLKAKREIPAPMFDYLRSCKEPPKIMGIRMEHLLCGPRKEAKRGSGQKVQYSPLIRGYCKEGITPDMNEFAYKFQWDDEFGTHRLGKGWVGLNFWEQPGGVRAWIDLLASGEVQADLGDALEGEYVLPIPYYRQAEDAEDWLQQMIAEELRKFEAVQRLNACKSDNERRFVLNTMLPQFRHSCDYPKSCPMTFLCFDPGYAEAPLGSGMYKKREPHHEAEKTSLVNITK
jgi:hypothetical protein